MAPVPTTPRSSPIFAGLFARLVTGPTPLDIIIAVIASLTLLFILIVMGVLVYDRRGRVKRSVWGVLVLALRIITLFQFFYWIYQRHQCHQLMKHQAALTAERLRREALTPEPGYQPGHAFILTLSLPPKASLSNIRTPTDHRRIIRSHTHVPIKNLPSLDIDQQSIDSFGFDQPIASSSSNARPLSGTSINSAQAIESIDLEDMDQPSQDSDDYDDLIFPFSPSDSFHSFHVNDSEATCVSVSGDSSDWPTGIYTRHSFGVSSSRVSRDGSMTSTANAVEDPTQTLGGFDGQSADCYVSGVDESDSRIRIEYFGDSMENCDSYFLNYTPKFHIPGTGEPMDYFIGQAVSQ